MSKHTIKMDDLWMKGTSLQEEVQASPVFISKDNEDTCVLISVAEYTRLLLTSFSVASESRAA